MIADIVVIIVMALCIFLGYFRGLIKVAVKILGFLAAFIVAFILYTPISNYVINNTEIVANIQKNIEGKIYTTQEENQNNNIQEENISIENYIDEYAEEVKRNGAEIVSEGAAITIVKVRNLDSIIYNNKDTNDIHKNICKHNRKNSNNKTIQ